MLQSIPPRSGPPMGCLRTRSRRCLIIRGTGKPGVRTAPTPTTTVPGQQVLMLLMLVNGSSTERSHRSPIEGSLLGPAPSHASPWGTLARGRSWHREHGMQPAQVRVGDLSPGNEPVPPQASAPRPPEPQEDLVPAFQRWPALEQRKHRKASQAARPRSIPLSAAFSWPLTDSHRQEPREFAPEDALQIKKTAACPSEARV